MGKVTSRQAFVPPNTSLELTMAAGGSGARHSGRWMLRAGSSARSR
jgi:hypothetical protein